MAFRKKKSCIISKNAIFKSVSSLTWLWVDFRPWLRALYSSTLSTCNSEKGPLRSENLQRKYWKHLLRSFKIFFSNFLAKFRKYCFTKYFGTKQFRIWNWFIKKLKDYHSILVTFERLQILMAERTCLQRFISKV